MKKLLALLISFSLLFTSLTPAVAGAIPTGLAFRGSAVKLVKNPEQLMRGMQRLGRANVRGYMANVLGTVERAGLVRSVNMHETLRNAGLVSANQFGEVSSPAFAERVLLGETSVAQLTGMDMEKYVFSGFTSQLLEGTVVPSTAQLQTELDMLTRYMKETRVVGGDVIKHFAQVWSAASYIGLLGARENGAEILALAEGNYGGLNPYVDYYATRILLNLEAYDELRALAKFRLEKPNGMLSSVWSGVKEEMAKRGEVLEVNEMDIADADPIIPEALQQAQINREPYMTALGDPSADITQAFGEIRKGLTEKFDLAHTQASAQQAVLDQLSIKPQNTPLGENGSFIVSREAAPVEVAIPFGVGAFSLASAEVPSGAAASETPLAAASETARLEMPESLEAPTVEGAIEQGLRLAEKDYLANPIHDGTTYAKFLTQHLKETLAQTGADLTAKEVINQLNFALLSPLADFPLLRQQVLDEVTGRTLSFSQKMGRRLATRLAGKQAQLPQVAQTQETVLQILTGSKEVPGGLHTATINTTTRTFTERVLDANGQEVQTMFSYPAHERSLFQLLGIEPGRLQNGTRTGLKDFSYAYSGVLKHRTTKKLPKKDGVTATITTEKWNDQTVFFSDQKMNLKPGDRLEVDALGNVYVLKANKGKTERKQLFDRQASVIYLEELGDMPVVFIQKVNDGLSALNRQFFLMGTSSTGRFLNSSLSDQYGDILGGAAKAEQLGTMISTGVYGTNLLALPFKKIVDKVGGKALLKAVLPATIVSFLWATGAVVGGADLHGWGTLVPVIASIAASGTAAAAIQQNANTAMKRMRRGKPASDLVAGGQLRKTLGSGAAYAFYTLATVLTGKWQLMYALVAWPALKAMLALWTTELPLPWQKEPKVNAANKPNFFKSIAQKTTSAISRMTKHSPVEAKPKKEAKKESFLKDSRVWPLALGLFLFCGSETQSSVATKSILSGVTKSIGAIQTLIEKMTDGIRHLPWMKDVNPAVIEDAFNVFVSGITTIVPLFLGRQAAKKLLAKYEDSVPHINEKMMFLSGIAATAMMEFMHAAGPELGAWLVLPVMLINGLMGNMFTFALNIMKNRDKAKYNNRFDSLAGTISTLAITGCFFIPTIAKFFFPATEGVEMTSLLKQQLAFSQLVVPIAAMITGMAINFKHFYNPLNWTKKLSTEELAKVKGKVLPSFAAAQYKETSNALVNGLERDYPNVDRNTIQQVLDKNFATMKAKASKALGVSEEVLDALARGEDTTTVLSDDALRKLGRMLGVSWKDLRTQSPEEINSAVSAYLLRQAEKDLRALSDVHTTPYN